MHTSLNFRIGGHHNHHHGRGYHHGGGHHIHRHHHHHPMPCREITPIVSVSHRHHYRRPCITIPSIDFTPIVSLGHRHHHHMHYKVIPPVTRISFNGAQSGQVVGTVVGGLALIAGLALLIIGIATFNPIFMGTGAFLLFGGIVALSVSAAFLAKGNDKENSSEKPSKTETDPAKPENENNPMAPATIIKSDEQEEKEKIEADWTKLLTLKEALLTHLRELEILNCTPCNSQEELLEINNQIDETRKKMVEFRTKWKDLPDSSQQDHKLKSFYLDIKHAAKKAGVWPE